MKNYAIKYSIGDSMNWYVVEGKDAKDAESKFMDAFTKFHGNNLLFKMTSGQPVANIVETKEF